MFALKLDFLSPKSWSPWRFGVLLLAVFGGTHAVLQRDALLARQSEVEGKIHRLEQKANRHEVLQAARLRQNPQQTVEILHIADELQRPWEGMLAALQRSARPDMQILRLQPESDEARLVIGGQAESSAAFLDYVARLRKDGAWKSVEPLSEETASAGMAMAGGKPVSFQLVVEWGGA